MNKQNSKKIKFSILDFAVVFIILALVVGLFARYDIVKRLFSKTSLSDAKITFIAEALSPEEVKAFKDNSVFYIDGEKFGTLNNITTEKALIYTETNTGTLVSYEDETLLDVRGSFLCKILDTKKGALLDGNRYIAAGSEFYIKNDGVQVKITIMSIEISE